MSYFKNVLVFDVETNGLLPREISKIPKDSLFTTINQESLPFVLQMSFIVYDPQNKRIIRTANHYINVSQDIVISDEITTLTGIDRKTLDENGVPITHALKDFYEAYMNCDCVVAHNIYFDRKMMEIEFMRNMNMLLNMGCVSAKNVFNKEFQERNRIDNFCTMNYGKFVTKVEKTSKSGEKYYKPPKLVELYEHLFRSIPENLHESMVDTYACLKCFAKMKLKQDISDGFIRTKKKVIC